MTPRQLELLYQAVERNETIVDIPLRIWTTTTTQPGNGRELSPSHPAAKYALLAILGLPPTLIKDTPKKEYRITVTACDVDY